MEWFVSNRISGISSADLRSLYEKIELDHHTLSFDPVIKEITPQYHPQGTQLVSRNKNAKVIRAERTRHHRPSAWLNIEMGSGIRVSKMPLNDPFVQMEIQKVKAVTDRVGIERVDETRMVRAFTRRFPTYYDFMELSMYDKDMGYYSTGNVRFTAGAHFLTFPNSSSPGFGRIAVELAFTMWQSMLEAGDIREDETFTILELGAGNGRLAKDMLDAAKKNSESLPEWAKFFSCLEYRIIEYSPALLQQQQSLLVGYEDRVKFQPGDAKSVGHLVAPKSINGLVFTNELPDAFPVHRADVQDDGTLLVQTMIPYLTPSQMSALSSHGIELGRLRAKSDLYKRRFVSLLKNNIPPENILVARRDLKKIVMAVNEKKIIIRKVFDFYELWIPDRFFPAVQAYRIRHQTSISRLETPAKMNVNIGMKTLISGIASALHKGFMGTVDYGYRDRVWAVLPAAREPRFFPKGAVTDITDIGHADITTDIPWTQFEREAREYFVHQCLVEQQRLGNPMQEDPREIVRWMTNRQFLMHVQKTRETRASYLPPEGL